ncbi:MAG: tetratricopeptide repeat protein [Flavobacteriales bacterium]|tara:strand:+ start:985 stop:1668 length:684 start_codon:yes stop_codon:yes gene_type:complete
MSKNIEENEDLIVDVQEVYSKTEDFIEKNKTVVIAVVLGVILVVGGFFGYKKLIIAPMEYEAQSDMFMAEKYFSQDSLQKAINGDGLNAGFIDIVDEYSGTKAANLAHYYLGICYINTGEYEFAIDELKQFSSNDVMISTVALGSIGDSYMELGDTKEAISYYEKAIENGENKLTSPIYLIKAGFAYEDLQDFSEAEAKYKALKANYPDSREAQTIDKYIARAESLK